MASTIIHLAIAKKILEQVKVKRPKDYFLGAIAPDISKQIGETKEKSHFLINTHNEIPNIDLFIKKYHDFKNNSFDLGYFTHLYADKIWLEDVFFKIVNGRTIKLLDGTTLESSGKEIIDMLYSDYTNLNTKIIEEYDLDLSLFYDEFTVPKTNIQEIPVDKLDILINKMSILIENCKNEKTYTIDMQIINEYIEHTTKEILKIIKEQD